jgi:hypothetical protein
VTGLPTHKTKYVAIMSSESYKQVALSRTATIGMEMQVAWIPNKFAEDDATQILGMTAIGRATVEALQLNREALVALRRVLVRAGEHPPLQ